MKLIAGNLSVYALMLFMSFAVLSPAWADSFSAANALDEFHQQALSRPSETAAYVLEYGEESLLARAWLADHAQRTIDVQYFIWSDDNIGTLAAEALLRAAERGIKVRVIVDDLLIDTNDKTLLALAKHPNINIRIYNPQHSVGTLTHTRVINLLKDFRGFNQRMHDKIFVVDGFVAITGGRNMADEYYDFDHEYNFRDRDVVLLGAAVVEMEASFERFWSHPLSVPVEELFDGIGIMQKHVTVNDDEIKSIYRDLHNYAASSENFAPEIRQAIDDIPARLPMLENALIWGTMRAINDLPGKNEERFSLQGGGRTTRELATLIEQAQERVVIQSPYLVLTQEAMQLFRRLLKRGVKIQVVTNSLASTDNLPAFSGFRSQRGELLRMGMEIFEYRPDGANQKRLMQRRPGDKAKMPLFALHAKSLVIDGKTAFIGTFNLDPRSINLNTETGVIIENATLAQQIEATIRRDMKPENSWNSAADDPDSHASLLKRARVRMLQFAPIKPLL